MATSDPRPVKATEMAQLRAIATGRPPFTSVYLPLDPTREDAAHQRDVTWRAARELLEAQHAPGEVLDRIGELVAGERRGRTVAVVVDADGNEVARDLPDPLDEVVASHGPLPRLGPLLDFAQRNPPHLVVRIDRRGADIAAVVEGSRALETEVEGDPDDPLTKVAPGGWSQRRFQERAENTWHRNAGEVADELAELVPRVGAELVVVAGDERAIGALVEQVSGDVAALVRVADTGGRAPDGSGGELAHEVDRIVATAVAERTAEVMRRFVEQRGQHRAVADGPGATFEALRAALVDTLLVHDDPRDQRHAWFDVSSPTLISTDAQTLRDLGFEPLEGRMVDAAIWSAFGTGAQVQLLPGSGPNVPELGVGALLRADVDLVTARP